MIFLNWIFRIFGAAIIFSIWNYGLADQVAIICKQTYPYFTGPENIPGGAILMVLGSFVCAGGFLNEFTFNYAHIGRKETGWLIPSALLIGSILIGWLVKESTCTWEIFKLPILNCLLIGFSLGFVIWGNQLAKK